MSRSEQGSVRRWQLAALGLLLAINVAVHVWLLHAAPYLDEGCFASSADWLTDGYLFYEDTWNERGPLFYYFGALYLTLAPATLVSVRLFAMFLSCIRNAYGFSEKTAIATLSPTMTVSWNCANSLST